MWSLGVLLYELYFLEVPFKCQEKGNLLRQIDNCYVRFPEKIEPLGRELILSLIKTDPKDRLTIDEVMAHAFFESLFVYGFKGNDDQP